LTDQYDASLLIMMKRFNWDYTDIFCNRYTISGRKKIPELSKTAKAKLLSLDVNFGEKLLYDAINKTWWEQQEVKDESFWEEVRFLERHFFPKKSLSIFSIYQSLVMFECINEFLMHTVCVQLTQC